MPYIGNTPADKFLTLAKQNFSTSATTSYTLDSAVSSTQDIALFINNVRQSPVDAYSVSGTSLTLTSATAGTDEMYCVYLGKTVGTVSPASNSVTTAMLQANAVTGAKLNTDVISAQTALGAEPADTDEFIVSDAGTLKRVDYSYIKGGGKILQVSHNAISDLGQATLNTGSWEAITTLTVSITPSATSSKIIVLASTHYDTGGASTDFGLNIYRDIASAGYNALGYLSSGPYLERNSQRVGLWNYTIVDSPSTTSACNYRFYGITGGTGYVDMKTANITLMEIDGS